MTVKDLVVLTEDGAWKSQGELNLIEDYDTTLGYSKIFYIKNPNRIMSAKLLNFKFSDPNYKFMGPKDDQILPLETVKVKVVIPKDEKAIDQFVKQVLSGKSVEDLRPPKNVTFNGKILWSVLPKLKEMELKLND